MTKIEYKNPRPTDKKITAIMLEQLNDSNEWEWYNILFDCTLQDAVNIFYENMYDEEEANNLKLKGREKDENEIITDECRAYYITI